MKKQVLTRKKLALNKQLIQNLDQKEMSRVVGGQEQMTGGCTKCTTPQICTPITDDCTSEVCTVIIETISLITEIP